MKEKTRAGRKVLYRAFLLRQNCTRQKIIVADNLESELLEEPLVLAGLVSFLELELDGLDGLSFASLVLKYCISD